MKVWQILTPLTLLPMHAMAAPGQLTMSLSGGGISMDTLEAMDSTTTLIAPRVGYFFNPKVGMEIDLTAMMGQTREGVPDTFPYLALTPRVGLLGRIYDEEVVQLQMAVGVGLWVKSIDDGGALLLPQGEGTDIDFLAQAGPGLRVLFGRNSPLAWRADTRFILSLGGENYENRGDSFLSWEFTTGLEYTIGGPKDADLDGIMDEEDACPEEAEDMDNFEDADGCPEEDNDKDGLLDAEDQCPNEAEDADGFEDTDGCPDADNDEDGILDIDDTCPDEAGTERAGGCPDEDDDMLADSEDECPDEAGSLSAYGCPDGDEDGVPDYRDDCPEEPAPPKANKLRSDGCPSVVYVTDNALVITEQIQFSTGRSTIRRASHSLLDKIARVLSEYKGIKKLQVKGHTDSVGDDEGNMALSQGRVQAVVDYLVKAGIEAERLEAKGFGESEPIGDNETSEGRAMNRRVEFEILKQDVGKRAKRRLKGKVSKEAPAEEAAAE